MFESFYLMLEKNFKHLSAFAMLLEKVMATYSSTLAWKIPWMEEPGRLQSLGSRRVGHDFTSTFHFHALEKEMAAHSTVLTWRSLVTGEPGGLLSMGSHRVGHNWSNLAAAANVIIQYYILSLFCVSTKTQLCSHLLWSILIEAIISWLWALLHYLAGHIKKQGSGHSIQKLHLRVEFETSIRWGYISPKTKTRLLSTYYESGRFLKFSVPLL